MKDKPYYEEKTITKDQFEDASSIISAMADGIRDKIRSDNFDMTNYQLTVTRLVETEQFVTIAMYLDFRA